MDAVLQSEVPAVADLHRFIASADFPCVGAKSALNRRRLQCVLMDAELGLRQNAPPLCAYLADFARTYPDPGLAPVSFAAIFPGDAGDEACFHGRLWQQLQWVHEQDAQTHAWASDVSDDPQAADFSFSVAGRAFFVVGLHPHSSRLARRSPQPTLVFNFHAQFEALKAAGRYGPLQDAIRKRDRALQGDINPVLARFGESSEARQYSGRNGGACPFHAVNSQRGGHS